MMVPKALRVDTDEGIKPDMAFLALLNKAASRRLNHSVIP